MPPSDPAAEIHDTELRLIAEQAQLLTLASGAAIALRQGELMVCRARAGNTAPVMGALLDTQSGLSGECVRSASALVCDDTENDSRVNLDVCRYLGIRSIAVLPICLGSEVVGVFEAFSAHPRGFSANEMAVLESMRDLVVSVVRPAPQPASPAISAPRKPPAQEVPVRPGPLPHLVADPADDLLCELEQRLAPQPEADPLTRAFETMKGRTTRAAPAPPPAPLPIIHADPDDDLICEIEMRSVAPPPQVAEPHPAHAFSAFTPAPPRPTEHTISRKLLAAGVIVVLAGFMWLRWCNHPPRAATRAAPAATVQAAAAPASTPAPSSAGEPLPSSSPPQSAAQIGEPPGPESMPDTESSPAADASSPTFDEGDASQPTPEARPRPAAPQTHAATAVINRQDKRTAARNRKDAAEDLRPRPSPPASSLPPVPERNDSTPIVPPSPVSSQQDAELRPAPPPTSAPPQSPPPFSLRPAPATSAPSQATGQLSLSQAVVTSAPESASAALSPDALRLLRDSAAAGDAGAQVALALRYANGDGVRQSYPEALKWFNRAQAQGVLPLQGPAAEAWHKVQQWAQSYPQRK